jgi:hypothetical protein
VARRGLAHLTARPDDPGVLTRVWDFLKVRKRYWLLPMLLVLALFAVLVMLSVGSEGNFVYTLN